VLSQVAAGVVKVNLDLSLVAGRALRLYRTRKGRPADYPNNQGDGGGCQQPGPVARLRPPDSQGCRAHLRAAPARQLRHRHRPTKAGCEVCKIVGRAARAGATLGRRLTVERSVEGLGQGTFVTTWEL
jgi:hypothetical protein